MLSQGPNYKRLNLDLEMAAKSLRKIKAAVYALAIIIGVCVAVVPRVYGSFVEVMDERWHERGSAYDNHTEYLLSTFLANKRGELRAEGYDPEGFLLSTLEWFHQEVYKSALNKIPSNDIERVFFWHQFYYIPLVKGGGEEVRLMKGIIQQVAFLNEGKSSTVFVDKISRLFMLYDFYSTYVKLDVMRVEKGKDIGINDAERQDVDALFLATAMNTLRSADIDYILKKPKHSNSIFYYVAGVQSLISRLILARGHYQEQCPLKEVTALNDANLFAKNIIQISNVIESTNVATSKSIAELRNNTDYIISLVRKYFPVCVNAILKHED